MKYFFIKRSLDIATSLAGLFLLALPMVFLSIVIVIKLGRPIFFVQVRSGLHARPFRMYKFRSMTNYSAENGLLYPDSERLTPFGRFLRSTSLDELPELWNVLKGDMSLVGPRPLFMEYVPLYTPEQARRLDVLPGITGWAQINGRNSIDWERKFLLDVWYVDNQTFSLDIKILCITLLKVLRRDGINAPDADTMNKFTGSI